MIPHSKPWITHADHDAVSAVLEGNMLAQGELTKKFEQAINSACDGVAVGSGAAAILLALKALDIGDGDEVILPTYVCRTVLEAVVSVKATPQLCDVGQRWVLDPENVEPLINARTKCIIAPHIYGIRVDIDRLKAFGVFVIEDCAQSLGFHDSIVLGDIAVYSFHATKCITTGEGGMAISSNTELVHRMRVLRDGARSSIGLRIFSPLSDLSSALGLSQLQKYPEALKKRKVIASRYENTLRDCNKDAKSSFLYQNEVCFRYVLSVVGGSASCQSYFAENGVVVRRGVDELLHRLLGFSDDLFENAVSLFESSVSLPLYPALFENEEQRCASILHDALKSGELQPLDYIC